MGEMGRRGGSGSDAHQLRQGCRARGGVLIHEKAHSGDFMRLHLSDFIVGQAGGVSNGGLNILPG